MYASAYVWAKILMYLEEKLGAITVSAWFDDAEVVELNEQNLILYSPSEFRRETIPSRFGSYIQDALQEIFKSDARLIVFSDEQLEDYRKKDAPSTSMDFNPQFSFDNFVVGPSNRFAHSAALMVSSNPGQVYNPLFLYGPSGVGKTHLLYSIANGIRKKNSNANIVYIRGDQFTNELIAALQSGKNVEFRSKYREADLFLIDDIQFIAGKEQTQIEFFNTFNKLYEEHKQIVMTSDRPPREMLTLEDRLRSRFESGLLADIQPPDYETRMAIIKNKSMQLGLDLNDEVCNFIALNVTNNVRQIEGAVKKILAHRDLSGIPLDLPHVSRIIDDLFKQSGSVLPTPPLIISQVCKYYSVDESKLRGTLKNKGTSEARQVAMYLMRKLTNLSLPDIGKELNKDHTTVMYGIRQVEKRIANGDPEMKQTLENITSNINNSL